MFPPLLPPLRPVPPGLQTTFHSLFSLLFVERVGSAAIPRTVSPNAPCYKNEMSFVSRGEQGVEGARGRGGGRGVLGVLGTFHYRNPPPHTTLFHSRLYPPGFPLDISFITFLPPQATALITHSRFTLSTA